MTFSDKFMSFFHLLGRPRNNASKPHNKSTKRVCTHVHGLTENDGHEIGGQDIYRLKIDYITMQCAILFKTTAEYKSQQGSKLYRPPVIVE